MAVSLLLRRGQARVLKTVLLEAQALRGLASTLPLSAESGKDEKGLPPKPKKQSVPKRHLYLNFCLPSPTPPCTLTALLQTLGFH
uniref:NADH:ubiquinone oxidoreductase core subunit V3 n=1 Tax=Jaculus jaculus TaxID=51337 RepID=A0A8C5KGJ0_JACJA